MRCKDCDSQCVCFLGNPPCSYCTDHSECIICGEPTCRETEEGDNICFACEQKAGEVVQTDSIKWIGLGDGPKIPYCRMCGDKLHREQKECYNCKSELHWAK